VLLFARIPLEVLYDSGGHRLEELLESALAKGSASRGAGKVQ
jgi:hypothetical protein